MKIALVHDFLIKNGGAEKVLQLLHKIYPEAPIYTILYDKIGTNGIFENSSYDIKQSSLSKYPNFVKKRSKILLPLFPRAIEEFDFSEYDIVISNSNSYAHGVITKPATMHICYCHSPIRYVWDWHSEYAKENNIGFGPLSIYIRKLFSQIRIWDYLASYRADYWIANSINVQSRIKKYYRRESTVIYPASDIMADSFSQHNSDYYLLISRLSPYKKIDLAVEAFNKNGKKLIIIGEGSEFNSLKKISKKNINFYGFVDDKTVKKALSECTALIFPGEEDFGLTPIEAMSFGKPVIAYGKGGVTETVIEGKTGIFFKKPSAESLNDAICRFEKLKKPISALDCQIRASHFSSKNFIMNFKKHIEEKYQDFKNEK